MLFQKLKTRRIERWWNKYGRKDAFIWTYRYLRLHRELLEDPVYQEMFDYHRAALMAYLKRDLKNKNMKDEESGELVDVLTDIFNRSAAERVNAYKPMIDNLYDIWKNTPDKIKEIRKTN